MTIPALVFTDWDGTVTLQDSNDFLTDNLGFGEQKRLAINDDILEGKTCFRDGFLKMLESVTTPFPECIEYLLANIKLDPGFKDFYSWCERQGIPVVVISSGMKPIIHSLLKKLIGEETMDKIEIFSNDVKVSEDGSWRIVYRHPEDSFGHDKARTIKEYLSQRDYVGANTPLLFYCGDGVSDLCAAKETNLLFAKHGKDLIRYCKREGIPYTEFQDFRDILKKASSVVKKEENIESLREN